jgi:hypothetical protein
MRFDPFPATIGREDLGDAKTARRRAWLGHYSGLRACWRSMVGRTSALWAVAGWTFAPSRDVAGEGDFFEHAVFGEGVAAGPQHQQLAADLFEVGFASRITERAGV